MNIVYFSTNFHLENVLNCLHYTITPLYSLCHFPAVFNPKIGESVPACYKLAKISTDQTAPLLIINNNK